MKQITWIFGVCCLALLSLSASSWIIPRAKADALQEGDTGGQIEPAAVELGRPVDFTRDVYPVLAKNCVACHNASVKEGGFVAENVPSILAGGDSGPAVVPEQLDESPLYLYATRAEEPPMPPIPNQVGANALTAQELGLVRQWILEGAQAGTKAARPQPQWRPVPAHIKSIHSVALSPCKRFVAWGRANQIYIYDFLTGRDAQRLIDANLSAIAYNGQPMYPAGAAHRDLVHALAFSPDGNLLASGGYRVVKLWRRSPAANPVQVPPPASDSAPATSNDGSPASAEECTWQLVAQLGPSPEDPLNMSDSPFVDRVLALDFSRDGKLLATGGGEPSRSGELMLWDVATLTRVREIVDAHSDTVCGVEFSRDNKYLLSGAADKFVKIFDVQSGQKIRSFEGHTHHVLDVSWQADGKSIVSAGGDNVIKYWNVETGDQTQTIGGFAKQVTSVQFPGTGNEIVSCSGDTSVRFHNAPDGNNFRNFGGATDFMFCVAASSDLSLVVAGGEDGVLRVWNGLDGSVMKTLEPAQ